MFKTISTVAAALFAGKGFQKFAGKIVAACGLLLCLADSRQVFAQSQPPIEIWLSERYGRWGDVEFYALGGRDSHPTPTGKFTVKAAYEDFYSNKYKAPMPLALFFTDQCAIHVGSLRTTSHGCIHVDWETAEYLFRYAEAGKTRIYVYD